jgi:hypothetical protein
LDYVKHSFTQVSRRVDGKEKIGEAKDSAPELGLRIRDI